MKKEFQNSNDLHTNSSFSDFFKELIAKKLSESVIEKADKIYRYLILEHQELSEEFIEKHADKVDWIIPSQYEDVDKSE